VEKLPQLGCSHHGFGIVLDLLSAIKILCPDEKPPPLDLIIPL
jgi:hypothetical protein